MHDLMVACQELEANDLVLYRSEKTNIFGVPTAPAPAVAELADKLAEQTDVVTPDEDTFAAMRWASKLDDDANVLGLIRSLPKEIVQEQVRLYEKRAETAVAEAAKEKPKLQLCPNPRYQLRMLVAQRFHLYCQRQGIVADKRMPYGAMKTFIEDNIVWKAKHKAVQSKQIRHWYNDWCSTTSNILAAVADEPCQVISKMSMLRSRAPQKQFLRRRAQGGGRPPKAPLIRQALYEWWSSIRYAIDWEQLAGERRSRGKNTWPVFLAHLWCSKSTNSSKSMPTHPC
jgi:hypothetical protein